MANLGNRPLAAALTTLGCKLNQAETEEMARRFAESGFRVVDADDFADVYVVNTCTVTHIADRKSRQLIRHLRRLNPDAIVAVTGCYVDTSPTDVHNVDPVDLIVANPDKPRIVDLVRERVALLRHSERSEASAARDATLRANVVGSSSPSLLPFMPSSQNDSLTAGRFKSPGSFDFCSSNIFGGLPAAVRTRSFLKIEDGCDKFCTFCIVPYARGRERSVPPEAVVASVADRVAAGHKEIVLTGVHIGTYGHDLVDRSIRSLTDLVSAILNETGVRRLRLSSIEPMDFHPAMLAIWSDRRVCRHMHLPLQSGSDAVLQRMRRRYASDDFARILEQARAAVPGLAITTDIIAGFPGESEDEFRQSFDFARKMEFAAMHVFKYSPRRGTRAAEMPGQVAFAAKKERSEALLQLGAISAKRFAGAFVGQQLEVLYETRIATDGDHLWEGLSDNYLRVLTESRADLGNQIRQTRIVGVADQHLLGSIDDLQV